MESFVVKTIEELTHLSIVLLPIIGVVIGALLTNAFNKKAYGQSLALDRILNKKIDLYEKLYKLSSSFNQESQKAFTFVKNGDYKNLATALEDIQTSALSIMKFFDVNDLYIDKDIIFQLGSTCLVPAGLGLIDPKNQDSPKKVESLYYKYIQDYQASINLIKEYMGLKRVERHLKNINKPKTTSPVLHYAHELEKAYGRNKESRW